LNQVSARGHRRTPKHIAQSAPWVRLTPSSTRRTGAASWPHGRRGRQRVLWLPTLAGRQKGGGMFPGRGAGALRGLSVKPSTRLSDPSKRGWGQPASAFRLEATVLGLARQRRARRVGTSCQGPLGRNGEYTVERLEAVNQGDQRQPHRPCGFFLFCFPPFSALSGEHHRGVLEGRAACSINKQPEKPSDYRSGRPRVPRGPLLYSFQSGGEPTGAKYVLTVRGVAASCSSSGPVFWPTGSFSSQRFAGVWDSLPALLPA